ncbi:MAG: hypothetical protein ACI9W4_000914 [Rhodothermales bacterium]|jgi:hypothetical protein
MKLSCKACGGGLKPDDERCYLCGTPAGTDPDDLARVAVMVADASGDKAAAPRAGGGTGTEDDRPVFCHSCGWRNPIGARFCAQCGSALQDLTGTGALTDAASQGSGATAGFTDDQGGRMPPGPVPDAQPSVEEGVGKRIGIIVGAAVMVIVALYMISAIMSQQSPVASGPQAAVPLTGEGFPDLAIGIAQQVEVLDDSLAAGAEKVGVLQRKVELLIGGGRYDLAAIAQEELAGITATEQAWTLAGNLYYDAMDRSADGTQQRTGLAQQAIAAYRQVLEINPDNLDVRTDMAVAYLWDPDNPMSAIQETAAVLERDSLHVQANFNRGIMLSQINRIDQALEQFRKVQRIVNDPTSDLHRRAEDAIASLRVQAGRTN